MRSVCIVEVPFMCGDGSHPSREGPPRAAAAAARALTARGVHVTGDRVHAEVPPATDPVAASVAVNRPLAESVRRAAREHRVPLVFAGSCDAALGVVGGLDRSGLGIVWLDAHGDFNTPESSESGFFPGMSLAVVTGHCHGGAWHRVGEAAPVSEAATALIGVRDLSPAAERERLERSAIEVAGWNDGRPARDVAEVLDAVTARTDRVYLHVDLDALDPEVAPGIVDEPVPGGLSLEQAEDAIRAVMTRFEIAAAAVTTYVPERDREDRTLRAQLRLVEAIAA